MSYIKIKDMQLPDTCARCPLAYLDSYGYRICFVTEFDVTNYYWYRHKYCPMERIEEE